MLDAADNRYFRLSHYARVLQYIGLPKSAYILNTVARKYLKGERDVRSAIQDEKDLEGTLDLERFGGQTYVGRWFNTVAPEASKRYSKKRYGEERLSKFRNTSNRRVFQGLRRDIFRAGMGFEPFTHEMLSPDVITAARSGTNQKISLFPDGTVQVFQED